MNLPGITDCFVFLQCFDWKSIWPEKPAAVISKISLLAHSGQSKVTSEKTI